MKFIIPKILFNIFSLYFSIWVLFEVIFKFNKIWLIFPTWILFAFFMIGLNVYIWFMFKYNALQKKLVVTK